MSDDELAGLPNGLSRAGGIFSRRRLLGTTTLAVAGAALAAGQQASAQQPQSVRIGEHNASASDPGPENEALALRELHWHPNADEWQYYIQGSGRMTVFFNRATARTIDFHPGDVGYIPQTLGHYIENTGDSDLVFLEMFKTPRYQDFSLNDWLTHIPPELVIDHLGISQQTLAAIPRANNAVLPA
jgi:oxalate decarboxylase family bicupin protein